MVLSQATPLSAAAAAVPANLAIAVEDPPADASETDDVLREIAARVLWLATAIVDAANHGRTASSEGVKVGGHQASSASMVDIMVSLWFAELHGADQVSVKPHASPVLHAINYLLGGLDERYLTTLRAQGGLQSYPSRTKDPDRVDFSTGSVGIGATSAVWAALAHRYLRSHFPDTPSAGRFISLVGDAELDEGAVWEAVVDPTVACLGEVLWIVDVNRQSLDRVVPDIQISRLAGMFTAAGWQTMTLKWGRTISALFDRPGGAEFRDRMDRMPNEEYQRLLRTEPDELADRIAGTNGSEQLRSLLTSLPAASLAEAVRDLGGHDIDLLLQSYQQVESTRPTVIFAYTIKGHRLPTEGHPNNHSALLDSAQMAQLAHATGAAIKDPWARFDSNSPAGRLCRERDRVLARDVVPAAHPDPLPTSTGRSHRAAVSTQTTFGRLLTDIARQAPASAARIVTCSPDVASSTNVGGWINKTGIWSARDRHDWFADDPDRVLSWREGAAGQHIELGIAEVNMVGLLGELGATFSRWGQRLIPIGTIYDPFVARALEPWSFGIYAGGQSILVGTPSGVTLAPEGGAHQSIITPSIGLEQPRCIAWEPAFAQDLEWCLLHAMSRVGIPGGTSSYLRLSTRPIDQALANLPDDPILRERRRRLAIAGGYRMTEHPASADDVTLVGVGAVMPEVLRAARTLQQNGLRAGVVCLTSPDLVYRSWAARGAESSTTTSDIAEILFPASCPAPLVSVIDGHPHTLSFLAGIRGDRIHSLGVTDFGQSSDVSDAYRIHRIDPASIVSQAMTITNGSPL